MKRHLSLIILLSVLFVLVFAYFICNAVLKNSVDESDTTENTVINVLSMYSSEISSISYTYEEKEVSLIKKDNAWKWTCDEEFPVNSSFPESMANVLSDITALRLISEDPSEYGKYGLDKPAIEVEFETVDGLKYVYTIGDQNTVTGGHYFKLNNSDKVYLSASSVKAQFEYSIYDMMQAGSFPTIKYESIKSLEYTMQGNKQIITTDKGNADFFTEIYTYFLVDGNGNTLAADGKSVAELLISIADLKFEKCESYKPDGATLEQLGLGQDKRVDFTVTYDEKNGEDAITKSYSFSLGCYDDEDSKSKVYCIREKDSNVVYGIAETDGKKLLGIISGNLESKYVCPVPSEKIQSFEIKKTDKTDSFTSEELKNDSKTKDLYNKITSLVADGKADKAKGELYLTVSFNLGEKTLELKVYKYDDKHYVCDFDKFENMLVPIEKINAII